MAAPAKENKMNKRERREALMKKRVPGHLSKKEKDDVFTLRLKEGWEMMKANTPEIITPDMWARAKELGLEE